MRYCKWKKELQYIEAAGPAATAATGEEGEAAGDRRRRLKKNPAPCHLIVVAEPHSRLGELLM